MPSCLARRRPLARFDEGIHLNFNTGKHYVKGRGAPAQVAPFTSLFTFTGDALSYYRGAAGLLVPSATNTPRIEYDASGNLLGLLIEATRTNLCLQSETMDNADWTKYQGSATANATTAPDGNTTADLFTENGALGTHVLFKALLAKAASADPYTYSFWAKPNGRTRFQVYLAETLAPANGAQAQFDLTGSGSVFNSSAFGTGTLISATINRYANGWYRCTLSATTSTAVTIGFQTLLISSGSTVSYTGDSVSGMYFWGAQLEQAAFASSYIPTTTGTVARAADVCTRTLGAEFSATAGTAVVAGRASGGRDAALAQVTYGIDDTGLNERFNLTRVATTDGGNFRGVDGGALQCDLTATVSNSTVFKAASAWAANDFAHSFNGAAVQTDGAGTLPTMTTLQLGGTAGASQMNGHILTFDYWPERKSNAFLQSLTT